MNQTTKSTIILGGGFTGLFTALYLSHNKYPQSVTLIDRNDRFSFNPMMYEYLSGEMSDEQVYPRYLDLLEGSGVRFVRDTAISVDLQHKYLRLASGLNYNYDNLVLALGSVGSFFGVEGAKEHSFLFRTGEQAIKLGNHLIKDLAVSPEYQSLKGYLIVEPTMQLPEYPEVFAGGDCALRNEHDLPQTAQVAYQEGKAIADNLLASAKGQELSVAEVNLRGTLLKLGLGESVANLFNRYQIKGKPGHLIRQSTYLTLLPNPIHNFKATTSWLIDEIFEQNSNFA